MSCHDPRAGLDALVLHCTHSLPATTLDSFIMVPHRVPLATKSQNIPSKTRTRKPLKPVLPALTISPPKPLTQISICDNASPDTPLSLSISTPCTPFQPLPPLLATSPLRLPSFLDLALESTPRAKPETPQPTQLVDSITHPNSPYVPWASPVRRNILRPLTPSSQMSRYSRPYSRSGARAPEPQDMPRPNRLLRLTKSLKNLKATVKQGVKSVTKVLRKSSKAKNIPPLPTPPLPAALVPSSPSLSPAFSCESSRTNTLADWLRDCAANAEEMTANNMTIEEYEERGSWLDHGSVDNESEVASPLFSLMATDDASEHVLSPSPGPASTTCTNSDIFPRLSMLDVWPVPPNSALDWSLAGMPGGWMSDPLHV
ncbi:hypothetical protein MIND_00459600 [Mycena indigotica]|uniref:Uncharacterized protein n=1 Tax=Mycena indigotica TaxID=2126181 RepID=A0A8H6SWJ6_9AGAR|nr:uncharacterized protein MIND_00459600 [Mycena indigotica]KAF7306679.1 hypothetical protein MIND_00459600 [Mycena indigotica]